MTINGFKVITLCGSTRFKDEFLAAQKRLTLEGNIVISVGLFGHSADEEVWNEGVKDMLDGERWQRLTWQMKSLSLMLGATLVKAQDVKSPMQNPKGRM